MSKRFFSPVLLFLFLFTAGQQPADILHYRFQVHLSDQSDTLNGLTTVRAKLLDNVSSLRLDLTRTGNNGKGMRVNRVTRSGKEDLRFSQSDNQVHLYFTHPAKKGDTLDLQIAYAGIPGDGLIISKNKYGKRTFFADNWPNRAHHWIPCVDDPADKASFEFLVTAPEHYQVISNGIQVEETNLPGQQKLTHWKEEIPLPTKVMVIGVAEFAVQQTGWLHNCIPVSSWVFPENKNQGFYDYAQATEILAFYDGYIGPYPFKKLANVQSKTIYGGMENAGAIFYSEYSVTGERRAEALIAHEIVHQWFGDMASEKNFSHLWLSEGFATYLTHIYLEKKYGTDSLRQRMREDRNQVLEFVKLSRRPVADTSRNLMSLLNANSYQKGSWILHMLRQELGDPVFHQAVRQYYAEYAGSNADSDDLQRVFEKVSGKDLGYFFSQWLHRPYNPELKITRKADQLQIEQVQKGLPFRFPLTLKLDYSGHTITRTFAITDQTHQFTIENSDSLLRVETDPLVGLLAAIQFVEF